MERVRQGIGGEEGNRTPVANVSCALRECVSLWRDSNCFQAVALQFVAPAGEVSSALVLRAAGTDGQGLFGNAGLQF